MTEAIISRTDYTFSVLHRTDSPPKDLHDAINEAEGGHAVGVEKLVSTLPVPATFVPHALKSFGNDGEFFDLDLEDDDV